MKLIFIALLLVISGCTTVVPVTPKFPEIPETLMKECPALEKLENGSKLSDIAIIIAKNYSKYNECAIKHSGFIEWYNTQQKIYEELK